MTRSKLPSKLKSLTSYKVKGTKPKSRMYKVT